MEFCFVLSNKIANANTSQYKSQLSVWNYDAQHFIFIMQQIEHNLWL